MAQLRAEVMEQPAAERVEYALDLLAYYLDPVDEFYQGCARLGIGLPNAEIRMLHALDARRGRYVSANSLIAARHLDRPCDEWASVERIVSAIARIRKELSRLGLPVEITNWRGIGYCLEAPEAFRFEAPARPRAGQ